MYMPVNTMGGLYYTISNHDCMDIKAIDYTVRPNFNTIQYEIVWLQWCQLSARSLATQVLGQHPVHANNKENITRTTRKPAFWKYLINALWLPILLIHIRFQVKERQSQSYRFEKFAKIGILESNTLHATHLLKLLIKMRQYEMDPPSIVEVTERTRSSYLVTNQC